MAGTHLPFGHLPFGTLAMRQLPFGTLAIRESCHSTYLPFGTLAIRDTCHSGQLPFEDTCHSDTCHSKTLAIQTLAIRDIYYLSVLLCVTLCTSKPVNVGCWNFTCSLNSILVSHRNCESKWSKLTLTPNIPKSGGLGLVYHRGVCTHIFGSFGALFETSPKTPSIRVVKLQHRVLYPGGIFGKWLWGIHIYPNTPHWYPY